MEDYQLERCKHPLGQEFMRAKEFSLPEMTISLAGTLQLYVPRPREVNEILKPTSGFTYSVIWTSTAKKRKNGYTSAWVEWCRSSMPQWLSPKGILYKVGSGARVLKMDTDQDAYKIAQHYGVEPPKDRFDSFIWSERFPWDDIEMDFDAVHHTPSGNRLANMLMSSWDVESTVWFNTRHLENLGEVKVAL